MPDDASQDEDAVNVVRWAAGDHIRQKRATSLTGLAVKLAYALYSDSQAGPVGVEIEADGFAGNNYAGLVAVYLDAVRLAGLPDDLWRSAWVDCGCVS